jgi:hypothetical protein
MGLTLLLLLCAMGLVSVDFVMYTQPHWAGAAVWIVLLLQLCRGSVCSHAVACLLGLSDAVTYRVCPCLHTPGSANRVCFCCLSACVGGCIQQGSPDEGLPETP